MNIKNRYATTTRARNPGRTFTNNGVTLTETQYDAMNNHDGADFSGKVLPSHRALVKAGLAVILDGNSTEMTYSLHLTEAGKAWLRADAGEDNTDAIKAEIAALRAENDLLRQIVALREENARLGKR